MLTLFMHGPNGDLEALKEDEGSLEAMLKARPSLSIDVPASFEDRVMFDPRARLLARLFFKNHGLRFKMVSDFSRHLDVMGAQVDEEE